MLIKQFLYSFRSLSFYTNSFRHLVEINIFFLFLGTASVARAFSVYFDSLIDKRIAKFFNSTMPMNVEALSDYPDFFAFGITVLVTGKLFMSILFSNF